jgi:hypothetical protein
MPTEFWWINQKKKKPLGRPGCRWEANIKMDVKEIRWRCALD